MAEHTTMPAGTSIFEELGRSAVPQQAQGSSPELRPQDPSGAFQPDSGGDTQVIVDLIKTGNVNDLVRANSMLQQLMDKKVNDAQRASGVPVTKPATQQPSQPAPAPSATPPVAPAPAPTGQPSPQPGQQAPAPGETPPPNVLADLTKLVREASKIGQVPGEQVGVQTPGASPVPPRPTNPQAGTALTSQLVPGRNPQGV